MILKRNKVRLARNIMAYIMSGALLSLAACQKIDVGDFTEEEKEKAAQAEERENRKQEELKEKEEKEQVVRKLETLPDGTLYFPADNHVVALEERMNDADRRVVYISLCEWGDISSALSAETPEAAVDIADRYREGDVSGWRMPSRDEARMLRERYNRSAEGGDIVNDDELQRLNESILAAGGSKLSACEKRNDAPAYRYLCENAQYTFSLKTGSKVIKAGKATKYHLRLVKDSLIRY